MKVCFDAETTAKANHQMRFETQRSTKNRSIVSHDRLFSFPLFAGRDSQFVQSLATECEVAMYSAGVAIVKEGDDAETTFFLVSGRVQISKVVEEQQQVLAELGSGAMFGELSLFIGGACRRTATVTALEFCDCRVIHQRMFNKILKRFPEERQFYDKLAAERLGALQTMTGEEGKNSRKSRGCANSSTGKGGRTFYSFQVANQQENQDDNLPSRVTFVKKISSAESIRPSTDLAQFGEELEKPNGSGTPSAVTPISGRSSIDIEDLQEGIPAARRLQATLPRTLRHLIGVPATQAAPTEKHFSILPGPRAATPSLPQQSRRRPLARTGAVTSAIGTSIHMSLCKPQASGARTAPAQSGGRSAPGHGRAGPDIGMLELAAKMPV